MVFTSLPLLVLTSFSSEISSAGIFTPPAITGLEAALAIPASTPAAVALRLGILKPERDFFTPVLSPGKFAAGLAFSGFFLESVAAVAVAE